MPRLRPTWPFVPVRYYESLLQLAAAHGVDRARTLAGLAIDEARFGSERGLLTIGEVEGITRAIAAHTNPVPLALAAGAQFNLSSHRLLGAAIATAPDVSGVVDVVCRYSVLAMPLFKLDRVEGEASFGLALSPRCELALDVERLHVICLLQSALSCARFLFGAAAEELVIEVPWSARSMPPGLVEALAPNAVLIGHSHFALHAPTHLLARPSPLADAGAHRAVREKCDALLSRLTNPAAVTPAVAEVVVRLAPPFPSLTRVAAELGLSPRTIARHLAEEGTSFREVVASTRTRLASRWLREGSRTIGDIAQTLGYHGTGNFTRAFRRDTGHAPTEFRRDQLGRTADDSTSLSASEDDSDNALSGRENRPSRRDN